jgi:hypothetical protein
MNKVQKASDSECCTPLSELFTIYVYKLWNSEDALFCGSTYNSCDLRGYFEILENDEDLKKFINTEL